LNRRQFLAGAAALPLLAQKRSAPPPNILLIIAEDIGSWMLGCYGNKQIRTPNIDQLAAGGLRFIDSFTCTPCASPSRATILTGRTPMQDGIEDALTPRPAEDPPQGQFAAPASFANEAMLSDVLAARGYRCGYTGKWNLGSDQSPQHKFDYWYTIAGDSSGYQNPRMSRNGQLLDETGYLTELITRHAGHFLNEQKPEQPFFLVAAYPNSQPPYDGHPQKYYDMYANVDFDPMGRELAASNALRGKEYLKDPVANLRKFAAVTTALDAQLPALNAGLQQRGLLDNTLIVFTSTNGYLLGRHGLWSDGHASDPINMYDEVMGVPVIWNWPGRVPVQEARPELISLYDLAPTLCEAAGVQPPARNLCGRSFLPIVTGKPMPKKHPWPGTVFGHFRNTEMARDNRFKLIVRNGGKGPNELYAIRADPREKVNEYDNPRFVTVRESLAHQLDAWRGKYSS
jgi:arylsulfatase A-like enzyme